MSWWRRRRWRWLRLAADAVTTRCFTFPINLETAIDSVEKGPICDEIKAWGRKNGVLECFYLARDMGAEPPRQTEIRCKLEPGNAWEQAMLVYDLAGFPYPPNDAIAAIQAAEDVYVAINITEEEFVVRGARGVPLCACLLTRGRARCSVWRSAWRTRTRQW